MFGDFMSMAQMDPQRIIDQMSQMMSENGGAMPFQIVDGTDERNDDAMNNENGDDDAEDDDMAQ